MGARLVGKKLPWRRTGEPCAPRQEKLDNRLRPDACGKSTAECYCTKLKTVSKSLIINEIVVEATGVEPVSENVTSQETTCVVGFMLPAFTGNVRGPGSESTRNQFR